MSFAYVMGGPNAVQPPPVTRQKHIPVYIPNRTLEIQVERFQSLEGLKLTTKEILDRLEQVRVPIKEIAACNGAGGDVFKLSLKSTTTRDMLIGQSYQINSSYRLHLRELASNLHELTIFNVPYEVTDQQVKTALITYGDVRTVFRPKMNDDSGKYRWIEHGQRFIKMSLNPDTLPPTTMTFESMVEEFVKCEIRKRGVRVNAPLCANCGQRGHNQYSCEEDTYCFVCRKKGHS